MKVLGKGSFRRFLTQDEGIHTPGPEELWQESVAQVWWDPHSNIGGFYRIGHETNLKSGPMAALWSTTFSPVGVFKHDTYLPLRSQDRSSAKSMWLGSGDELNSYHFDGNQVWTLRGPGMELDMRVQDYHEQIDCYPKNEFTTKFAPAHIEVAGTVSGKLKMKDQTYDIDGFSIRDKGWGERKWTTLLSHRWTVAVFGPELSLCALNWHSTSDQFMNFGWVVRDNQIIFAEKLDFLAFVEADGITTRGGHLVMQLSNGETLRFEFEGICPSAVSYHHGVTCVDTLSRVRHNERVGYGCFETTHNAQNGSARPLRAINGILGNGWHDFSRNDVGAILPAD